MRATIPVIPEHFYRSRHIKYSAGNTIINSEASLGDSFWRVIEEMSDPTLTDSPVIQKITADYPISVPSATVAGFNVEKLLSLIEYQYGEDSGTEFPLSAGIIHSNGIFSDSSSYVCTDFIPVTAGQVLSFQAFAAINVFAISAYAGNDQGSIILDSQASILGKNQNEAFEVTVPAGVNYVRICNDKENNDISSIEVLISADGEKRITAVGFKVNLYSKQAVSALNIGGEGDGGAPTPGGGLIQAVYGYGDLNKTFSDLTLTDTFNAYTIANIAARVAVLESTPGGSLSFTQSGAGNVVTGVTESNGVVTVSKGLTISAWAQSASKPAYTISEISGMQTALDAKLDKAVFEDLFEKVNIGTSSSPVWSIKAKYGLWTEQFLTALGSGNGNGGTGGGLIQTVYGYGDLGGSFSNTNLTDTFNAYTINAIYNELKNNSNLSFISSGTGNVVTDIIKSGTTITYTKGLTISAWALSASKPVYSISEITGLQTALDAKLDKSVFDDLFEKVNMGTDASPKWSIKAKYGLWTEQFLTALGSGNGNGGTGGGLIQTVYGYGDLGDTFSNATLTDTFNAYTINSIYNSLLALQNSVPISFVSAGTGNVVTDITKSGNTVTFNKGITALTTADLSNYVTLGTQQTITGRKTFTYRPIIDEGAAYNPGINLNMGGIGKGTVHYSSAYRATALYNTASNSLIGIDDNANPIYITPGGANKYTLWHTGNFTPGNYVTLASLTSTLTSYVTNDSLAYTLQFYTTNTDLASKLANYVTNTSLASTLANYVTSTTLSNTLASYATQSWVSNMLNYYVDTIIIGNTTAYRPTNGRIYLPAYPTVPDIPAWALAASKPSYAFSEITGKPSTLAGYGITDGVTSSSLTSTLTSYVTNSSLSSTLASYATQTWVNTQLAGYLRLTGGTLTGNLAVNAKLSVTDTTSSGDSSDSISTAGGIYADKNIIAAGAITALAAGTSDIRLKRDIKKLNGLSVMRKIGKAFLHHWNEKALSLNGQLSNAYYNPSWSAQDVRSVFPVASIDGLYGGKYLGINRETLLPLAWNAVIEVDDKVTKLQKRVRELENEISIMKGERYAS